MRYSVLPKVFWAPVLRTSGSWNLPIRMEGSLIRNFNNYYVWYMFLMAVATDFTHVTINLVCCCLSPVLISHKRSCWKISQSNCSTVIIPPWIGWGCRLDSFCQPVCLQTTWFLEQNFSMHWNDFHDWKANFLFLIIHLKCLNNRDATVCPKHKGNYDKLSFFRRCINPS